MGFEYKMPVCPVSCTADMSVCVNCREFIGVDQPFGTLRCCNELAHEACVSKRLSLCRGMASFRCASCWAEVEVNKWPENFKLSRKRAR